MWQALYEELRGAGLEIVTVALDTGGIAAAGQWIDAAAPTHPSLIDESHVTDELFGFVNVPNAVWIDEEGVLVRPAHPAHVQVSQMRTMEIPEGLGRLGEQLAEVKKIRTEPERYVDAIKDWVAKGPRSSYAMTADEVVAASRPRSRNDAEAAAAFELGQHHWRAGDRDAAVRWFRRAHELQPTNWTYKRQAWTFATTAEGEPSDLVQGPNDLYEGNWLDDVRAAGAANYYEPFDS